MISLILQTLLLSLGISYASQLSHLEQHFDIQRYNHSTISFDTSKEHAYQLLGDIEDFSFYRYTGQGNFTNAQEDTSSLIYANEDVYIRLLELSNSTQIERITPVDENSFILSGSGYIHNNNLANQLLFNLSSFTIWPIFNQELNNVTSVLVDEDLVYFGGNFAFTKHNTTVHSIAAWNRTSNTSQVVPFGGFGNDSHINSIAKLNKDNILFAGKFYTLDYDNLLSVAYSNNFTNSSNGNNITSVELSQQVSLEYASWTEDATIFDSAQFICPDSSSDAWYKDALAGEITSNFLFDITPSKLRIYNSPNADNEVSSFRIIAGPSNGIMNLTYVDPADGVIKYCDAFCPLYQKSLLSSIASNSSMDTERPFLVNSNKTVLNWTPEYQEFAFVNQIEMSSLTFSALSSYGDGVALAGLKIYQSSISAYANDTLNTIACNDSEMTYPSSTVLSSNDWKQGLTGTSYITTKYVVGEDPIPKVIFYPHIYYPGSYAISIYTPGCLQDNSCSSRGVVNVTVIDSITGEQLSSNLIYQNNNEVKYDQLYEGYLADSPQVIMTFDSAIDIDGTEVTVVADYVDIDINSINLHDNSTTNGTIALNGLFQYQLSNFSSMATDITQKIGNTSLNYYTVDNFPQNSSILASIFNSSVLLGGAVDGIAQLALDNNLNITSANRIGIGGNVSSIGSYGGGVVLLGEFNISGQEVSSLSYNGTFDSFGDLHMTVADFSNITINEEELLIFNNKFVFNVSDREYITNTTGFNISVFAAARNGAGDTIFAGDLTQVEYSDIGSSIRIYDNTTIASIGALNHLQPYFGLYLNQSLSLYAYPIDNDYSWSQLIFSNGRKTPWSFHSKIKSMVYSTNTSILVGSTSGAPDTTLFALDLGTLSVLANETLENEGTINTVLLFPTVSSVLVGGNFSISNPACSNLCLYNYQNNSWSSISNKTISGRIDQLQFNSSTQIIISGDMKTENKTTAQLLSMNLTSLELTVLDENTSNNLTSFTFDNQSAIIAWNDTCVFKYQDNILHPIYLPNTDSSSTIKAVSYISTSNAAADAYLVFGEFYSTELNHFNAFLYQNSTWQPYFIAHAANSLSGSAVFSNRDLSSYYISSYSLQPLTNTSSVPSSPSSTSSATSTSKVKTEKKIDRGFVVLIGLALAMGTVAVLGILGIILAYIFRDKNGQYEPITPRIDENEMFDTVPPEKLMKFI